MAGLDSGATGIDRTSADTRALRVFGLGADEASAAPETAEGSGAAAASAEGASLAAGALGGVSLVAAGLRRRRRPLPERAASAGAWPLSVWAGAASGGRATEEGAPGSVGGALAGALAKTSAGATAGPVAAEAPVTESPVTVSPVARSPLTGALAAAVSGPASGSPSAGSAERPRADAAATAAGPDIRFPLPFPPLP